MRSSNLSPDQKFDMLAIVATRVHQHPTTDKTPKQIKELLRLMKLIVFMAENKKQRKDIRQKLQIMNQETKKMLAEVIQRGADHFQDMTENAPQRLIAARENLKQYEHEITKMI